MSLPQRFLHKALHPYSKYVSMSLSPYNLIKSCPDTYTICLFTPLQEANPDSLILTRSCQSYTTCVPTSLHYTSHCSLIRTTSIHLHTKSVHISSYNASPSCLQTKHVPTPINHICTQILTLCKSPQSSTNHILTLLHLYPYTMQVPAVLHEPCPTLIHQPCTHDFTLNNTPPPPLYHKSLDRSQTKKHHNMPSRILYPA